MSGVKGTPSRCDGAGARRLVRGSLKTWHVYIDVASPPSLAPRLDIFVIQHLFKPHCAFVQDSAQSHLFEP